MTSPTSSPSKRPRKLKSPIPSGSFHYGQGHHTPMSMGSGCSALGLMPMSAPAKICQTSPALDLLENKKKVQRNSLYHWVLWREALRGIKDCKTQTAPCHSPVPDSHSTEKWAWLGIKLGQAYPTPSIGGTALVCKMLFGGEKRTFRTKNTPVPTCARLSFKLKIRYISILHPVKKKCIFCTQKRLKNT